MREAQRLAALAVQPVLDGSTLPAALASSRRAERDSPGRRRALVQELAYGTLRHWGTLDALVRKLATKPIADPALRCLVAVAIYQLDAHARAVVRGRRSRGERGGDRCASRGEGARQRAAASLSCASARRSMRRSRSDPVARWSHPALVDRARAARISRRLAGRARRRATRSAPLALRVNRRVTTREALLAAVRRRGRQRHAGRAMRESSSILAMTVRALPGFDADGAFSVQDLGAQLAAPLLQPLRGPARARRLRGARRQVDALARARRRRARRARPRRSAPRARAREPRSPRLAGRGVRRRSPATPASPRRWWDGRPFDRILADVPCTATGVVRRHPDVKWLRREADIASFARQQSRILDALWPCLAQRRASCSTRRARSSRRRTRRRSRRSSRATPRRCANPSPFAPEVARRGAQLLPSLPGASHNQDGYFYALLRKP